MFSRKRKGLSAADLFRLLKKGRLETLVAANYGGLTDRIRCLLTCSLVASQAKLDWSQQLWSSTGPVSSFELGFIFNVALSSKNLFDFYDDWVLLTPSMLKLSPHAFAFCFDALNGDGFKTGSMLYYMADSVYEELHHSFHKLFTTQFANKVKALEEILRSLRYAVISLRFWREITKHFHVKNPSTRLNVNIDQHNQVSVDGFIASICYFKWNRLPPSLYTLREVRQHLNDIGYRNVLLMSERFNARIVCEGDTIIIRDFIDKTFVAGLERVIASYFVIAHAGILYRSKDSGFNHLPLLLCPNKSTLIVDI